MDNDTDSLGEPLQWAECIDISDAELAAIPDDGEIRIEAQWDEMWNPRYYICRHHLSMIEVGGIQFFPTNELATMSDGLPGIVYKTRDVSNRTDTRSCSSES